MPDVSIALCVMNLIIWRIGIPFLIVATLACLSLHYHPGITRRLYRG